MHDVERWVDVLRPRFLVPYAEFIFDGARRPDLAFDTLARTAPDTLADVQGSRSKAEHLRWCRQLGELSQRTGVPLLALHPMQGVRA